MSSTLVDVITAVNSANKYMQQIKDLLLGSSGKAFKGLRLEETELSEDKQHWLVTLGFDRPFDAHRDQLIATLGPKYEREYRVFKIDAQTGEVQAMKIRKL